MIVRGIIDNGKRSCAASTRVQQRFTKASGYGGSAVSTTDSCGNIARRWGWTRGGECRGWRGVLLRRMLLPQYWLVLGDNRSRNDATVEVFLANTRPFIPRSCLFVPCANFRKIDSGNRSNRIEEAGRESTQTFLTLILHLRYNLLTPFLCFLKSLYCCGRVMTFSRRHQYFRTLMYL